MTKGVIRDLARKYFEVIVLRPSEGEDDVTKSIDGSADRVVKIAGDYRQAREQIAAERLDIALYADIGMSPLTYALAYSRLAPVQCVGWGHPDTTGIPSVDYYLSSGTFDREDAQDAYTERLVRLGRIYCDIERPSSMQDVLPRSRFELPDDAPLYLCAQSTFKLHPDFDEVLAALLNADEKGIVLISSGAEANWNQVLLSRLARTLGALKDRVRILPRVEAGDFPGLLAMADAIIDPIHFTGGYTSYLTFAAGLPIVTWDGELMRGRMTAGLYRQMGHEDLIAQNAVEFVALAVRLANDATFRQAQRHIIESKAHLLFNDRESIGELGSFLMAAVEASVRGELVDWQPGIAKSRAK